MIKSMTGYGSETLVKHNKNLTVDIRSVNHRYCEINIRLPKKLFFLENAIKNQIKTQLLRGKIDVFITCKQSDGSEGSISYNKALAEKYVQELHKMSAELFLENDLSLSKIMLLPDLFVSEEEEAEDYLEEFILEGVALATNKIKTAREIEGKLLEQDIVLKLSEIESLCGKLPSLEKQSIEEYRVKITEKIKELLQTENIEESRIITEVAFMADRISIDEEIVRLNGHIVHMRKVLQEGEAVGKKLDFIVQEMNREVNTMASKALNLEIKNIAIEMKNGIEKIREQIQNIE